MGLFGGDSRTDASTTTTTTNSNNTTTRDIGFTGQQAVDILGNLTNGVRLSLGDLNTTYQNGLSDFATFQGRAYADTLQFGGDTVSNVLDYADRANARMDNSLSNVFNLVRDVSQRSLNVSSGQETPIVNVPAATAADVGDDKSTKVIFVIAAIVGIFAFFK